MKTRNWIKKNRILILTLLAMALTVVFTGLFLATRSVARQEDPIQGVNERRSQVLVTGEDYTLNYDQEQEVVKEQKQKEEQIREEEKQKPKQENYSNAQASKAPQNQVVNKNPTVQKPAVHEPDGQGSQQDPQGQKPAPDPEIPQDIQPEQPPESGGGDQGSGEIQTPGTDGDGSNTDEDGEEEISKDPSITCSLKDGEEISGTSLTMKVKVKDYKNNYLSSFYVEVYVNGTKIGSSGTTNNTITYRYREMRDGNNEVVIKARDAEGNDAQKTYHIIADADAEQKIGGTVTITVEAKVLNLGTFLHRTTEFYEGENVADVVKRECESAGYQVVSKTGTVNGFYVSALKKPGITDGWSISQEMLDKLGITDPSDLVYEKDSLGEKHFTRYSGWVYTLNGAYPDGMSVMNLEDGDEIIMSYTLDGY